MASRSLNEIHASVSTAAPGFWKRLFAFAGPAYLISVGYMDPGNWATDIEGGSRFGYNLLWVLVLSNLMAILLQTLSARLGIVARRDLAQACRDAYPRAVNLALWVLCEIAIAACDLAEVLGAAIALNLLFHIPLLWAVLITSLDVFLMLALLKFGVRKFESFILVIIAGIAACFLVEILLAKPIWSEVAGGLVPRLNADSLYVAVGMLGATVMPHNLYLHSSLVQTRKIDDSPQAKRQACRYNLIDSVVALNAALLINAAILILAGAVFFQRHIAVTEIQQAHVMLAPLLGTTAASVLFGVALLLSGQSSTLTGTLAGQVVMEGFLNLRMQPMLRRGLTRMLAIIPAALTIYFAGESQAFALLILSQVVLSLQLPFAVLPLVRFTSDRKWMGEFASSAWVKVLAGITSGIILLLNLLLAKQSIGTWLVTANPIAYVIAGLGMLGLLSLLGYVIAEPFLSAKVSHQPSVVLSEFGEAPSPLYRKILVSLDHTTKDLVALRHAASMARQHQAAITLVHVEEGAVSLVYGSDSSTAEVLEGKSYFTSIEESLSKQDIPSNLLILHSNSPSHAIISTVRELQPDLLIMAAHGHGRLGDLVYGQTIERVRHSIQIPILIVQ